uniref:Biogenesis of lysosome-related organelles complex 1 subunit 5 n=2 Tax=Parascaris univalens TaxID=6257 RepID=A0A915ABV4_PARUN
MRNYDFFTVKSIHMLESIREAFANVQTELSNSVQKFRISTSPSLQSCSSEAISSLLKTQAGSNLLLKYQLSIEQIEQVNNENIRLANLCSTRMGRAQQMCNERAECVLAMHEHFRALPQISKQLKELNRQVDKLKRFCIQTELAMTHLEALYTMTIGEQKIEAKKATLKKEKQHFNEIARKELNWISSQSRTSVFTEGERRLQEVVDEDAEKREELMLEEFLSR